jgi:glycosyltransferase involved in cell wall biosynthesis
VKVVVVSGIWPPDVGGPASHAPEVAAFLHGRGHSVEAVVTADEAPAPEPYTVRFTSRRLPVGVRHLHAAALVAARARRADVVYTTGMFARSAFAARAVRTPYVVKLTGDPAFERARARGVVDAGIEEFQRGGGGVRSAALRRLRDVALRGAAHVFCPSAYLRELAIGWGVDPARASVLPNPAPHVVPSAGREQLRARLGFTGPTLVFAGRLTAQKALPLLFEAAARADGVALVVAGDGPEAAEAERFAGDPRLAGRVRLLGAQPRAAVLDLYAAADAAILASSWENFPHAVVEALAAGTPVIATAVGGVAEVVRDGENGLLVPPGDPEALAAAVRRLVGDEALRDRLRAATLPSVEPYRPERLLLTLEDVLVRVAR